MSLSKRRSTSSEKLAMNTAAARLSICTWVAGNEMPWADEMKHLLPKEKADVLVVSFQGCRRIAAQEKTFSIFRPSEPKTIDIVNKAIAETEQYSKIFHTEHESLQLAVFKSRDFEKSVDIIGHASSTVGTLKDANALAFSLQIGVSSVYASYPHGTCPAPSNHLYQANPSTLAPS